MAVRDTLAAVVFDFDGVLADSEPLHLRAFRAVLASRGWSLSDRDYYAHFLGYNDEDAFAAMASRYAWSVDAEDIRRLVELKLEHTARLLARPDVLYPDAEACVRRLARRVPLAIASGAAREEIELVLRAHGLTDEFQAIVASGETPRSKPAPDPYARAVALLQETGVVPAGDRAVARCVAVEDSHWGIVSAKEAGLRCVAVTTSYPASELGEADLVVACLEVLTVERLANLVGDRT